MLQLGMHVVSQGILSRTFPSAQDRVDYLLPAGFQESASLVGSCAVVQIVLFFWSLGKVFL